MRPLRSQPWPQLVGAFTFRASCNAAMVWLALFGEARPAPTLPDALLPYVPYVGLVDRYNYWLWLAAYVPVALALWRADVHRFLRYMVSSGLLALLRGVFIFVTGLGPVRGQDVHAGLSDEARVKAFFELVSPFGFFAQDGGARLYLTKDLFFSGHTATTFLLLLYVWPWPRLRVWMLVAHVLVVLSVFLAHLHYTLDVLGAYAVTLALFAVREGVLDVRRGASP